MRSIDARVHPSKKYHNILRDYLTPLMHVLVRFGARAKTQKKKEIRDKKIAWSELSSAGAKQSSNWR